MFTINIWLLVGFSVAIVYLLWLTHNLAKALKGTIYLHNYQMSVLDEGLQERDAEVEQKISVLREQVDYLGQKYGGFDYEEEVSEVPKTGSK